MIIEKIILSKDQPQATNVLWVRPLGNSQSIYIYNNGTWKPLSVINDNNTSTPDDDISIDLSQLKAIDDPTIESMAEEAGLLV